MSEQKNQYNIAILGFGSRANALAEMFRESVADSVRLKAVVDPAVENARKRLKLFEFDAEAYTTPEEMIAAENDIDGILICTPDNCHLESFRDVKSLNKPLWIEKPLEGDPDNFKELQNELAEYKAPVMVGHCQRHAPILKKAKELLDQGIIGEITSLRCVQNCYYGGNFFRRWHRRKEVITSLYVEKATHEFDIMHMLNGENYAESVFAFSRLYKFGGDKPNDLTCDDCNELVSCPESPLNAALSAGKNYYKGKKEWDKRGLPGSKCVWAQEVDIGDDEMCLIEFSNGVQGSFVQTYYTPKGYKGNVHTVVGKEGLMEIELHHDKGNIKIYHRYAPPNDVITYEFDFFGRGHYDGDTFIVRNFLGIMQGTEEPWTTVEAAVAAEKTGLAAARSVETRQLEKV